LKNKKKKKKKFYKKALKINNIPPVFPFFFF